MPNLKELKNRISSVKSTRKITSAMKMVAASKLRRAQDLAESSRVYADSLSFILSSLAGNTKNSSDLPEILTGRENSKISLLIINSSDRGLCGGFNSNLFRNAKNWISEQQEKGKSVKIITVGKKASSFYRKTDLDVIANFDDLNSNDKQLQVSEEIKNKIMELFENNEIDEVSILFNKFVSVIAQEPTYQSLIPLSNDEADEEVTDTSNAVFEFEPDKNELLEYLVPRNFLTQIYRSVLESSASEHAARMTSMDNATRNAGDMIDGLTLTYNRTRQAFITKELIEIISGAEAV
ncbi:MAG: F0F1 ATP synthase subunit gamma [Pelagibacteraceae bacterium]|jgi:F-type H+-transporting ATPase subunit gamma|nr:F0F1 ATP synthase subunit gamma [Pelagibacteraceae bacterium]MDC3108849.1 F0F1 ATP synthase subunit gamma [Alphaproteobacteria bacterium]|tara:strand:- start:1052 stop:1933 length:882 start_codon:yes stop_codon:yes gene_type:complete